MSEIAAESTVTESAPTSTAEVASQVIDSYEGVSDTSDSGIEASGDAPNTEPAKEIVDPVATPPVQATAEPSPEDKEIEALLAEFGFKEARKPDGREHYIPRSKVLKMIGSGLKRGQEKWSTERGVYESQVKELTGHLEQLRVGVAGDPKAFLAELAGIDPRYKAFLESPQPQQTTAQALVADERFPDGDYPLPDGSRTFSLEGIKTTLVPWIVKQVEAGLLPKVDERLKPLTEREQREQQRAQLEQIQRDVAARTQQVLADAQTWPGFKDHESDILKALQQDSAKAKAENRRPTLTLEAAYRQVVLPRLIEDDNAKRARLLAELNQAPRGTATSRQTTDTPRMPTAASTQDIAARTLARLERGA